MSIRLTSSDKKRLLTARSKIIRWFSHHGRSFFWRKVERNPYRVLVTEFMLQQTQTFRVEEYLPRFLKQFPSIRQLAKANTSDVIKAWQGLGYNRRALNLHRTAKEIVEKCNGKFPKNDEALLSLPGIGDYTMRALQVFAFGKRVSVVDVNVIRVISRLTKRMATTNAKLTIKDIHNINTQLLPRKADKWHEALMDLGATICKSKPNCVQCPARGECASYPVLSSATHVPQKKNPNEHIYFGKPKRIWRGKILKLVAENNKIHVRRMVKMLISLTTERTPRFNDFIGNVARELAREGLCKFNGSYITIASDERTA